MPEVVQTGISTAIDFLSGFGKGMVQADVNRREQEKHEVQKQRWQQEMTAFAAQDEFRRLQNENSRLEIDMRKTQFDDIVATREQTKGFVAGMADFIGKVKGNPAEKQSQLLEAYTQLSAEFSMADRSIGNMLIDNYAKIHTSSAPKAWKIEPVKNFETGKQQQAIISEYGDFMGYLPGEVENVPEIKEIMDKGVEIHQEVFDTKLQAFLRGQVAVLGAKGQSLSIDDFMKSVKDLDDRDKSRVTMDWIFDVHDRLWLDIHKTAGTLDQRLYKMLKGVVRDEDIRKALVKPYKATEHAAELEGIVGNFPAERQAEVIAAMKEEFERLLPAHELPVVERELARLQNKTELSVRETGDIEGQVRDEQLSMAEQVSKSNRQKEEELLKKFVGYEAKPKGMRENVRDWWDNFLGQESGTMLFGDEAQRESEAYETLRSMQQAGME